MRRALDTPLHEGLKIEADLSTLAFNTEDAAEGTARFPRKAQAEVQGPLMRGDGKVIAVTGASRGIGAAIALALARRGHHVGCLTRKGEGIEPARRHPDAAIAERLTERDLRRERRSVGEAGLRGARTAAPGASTAW